MAVQVQQFSRPQEARQIEARGRARSLGVRVEELERAHAYQTRSQSQPGVIYSLNRTPSGWQCSCAGFIYTGVCKHVAQVERRSEREGWAFGRVAPRPADSPRSRGVPFVREVA